MSTEVLEAVRQQHQEAAFEPGVCATCLVQMPCPTLVAIGDDNLYCHACGAQLPFRGAISCRVCHASDVDE